MSSHRLIVGQLFAFGVVVLFASASLAQEPVKEAPQQTKMEGLLAKTGEILIKEFYELGRVSGVGRVTMEAVVLTPPAEETARLRGMRIEVNTEGRGDRADMSFLDFEEVEMLAKVLEYMTQLALKWRSVDKQEYSEVEFATTGGMRIGFYQRRRDQGAFVSSGDQLAARAFIDIEDLEKIRTAVLRGLSLLNSK